MRPARLILVERSTTHILEIFKKRVATACLGFYAHESSERFADDDWSA